jgi:predicted RNA-binding protein
MCEFQILVVEPGKKETLAVEDISYLELQEDGSILLRGLGIQEKVDGAIIKMVNTYAEDGATAKLFKAPFIKDFMKVIGKIEAGSYSPELEDIWHSFVEKGSSFIEQLKNK